MCRSAGLGCHASVDANPLPHVMDCRLGFPEYSFVSEFPYSMDKATKKDFHNGGWLPLEEDHGGSFHGRGRGMAGNGVVKSGGFVVVVKCGGSGVKTTAERHSWTPGQDGGRRQRRQRCRAATTEAENCDVGGFVCVVEEGRSREGGWVRGRTAGRKEVVVGDGDGYRGGRRRRQQGWLRGGEECLCDVVCLGNRGEETEKWFLSRCFRQKHYIY
ncbi:hypothetical protein Droror1_Dr00020368 [Drosera rotundifolia]